MLTSDAPRIRQEVPTWHESAACRLFPGNPDLWADPVNQAQGMVARIVCRACPVRLRCAVDALERREPWGIWGGLDRTDRAAVAGTYGYLPPGDPPEHGTNSRYAKWSCRCHECRRAHTVYEADRRARRRVEAPPFAKWLRSYRLTNRWQFSEIAEQMNCPVEVVREVEEGRRAPDRQAVTALVRWLAVDAEESRRIAEELHLLAGTATGVVEVNGERVLIMAGSSADAERAHLRALPAGQRTGGVVKCDRAAYRRRMVSRRRRRRR